MGLFRRCNLTNCSLLVTMGYWVTRNTLAPKLATRSEMYWLVPRIMETTTINVATERITPSRVRKERSLWVRKVSRAIKAGSRRETRLRERLLDCDAGPSIGRGS